MDLLQFKADRKTYDAVERCLQRITEAVIRLGEQAPVLMPDQPWRRIRGFGNRLRHDYDNIEEDWLFTTIRYDLPMLSAAAQAALQRLQEEDS